jgi:hypothetical protein
VKRAVLIPTVVAILTTVALTPYALSRWEFYRLTGSFTPRRIVETLQTPVRIGSITENGLLTADGKLLLLPGITNVVISESVKKDIVEHGVETAPDGAIYALVRVHHWCGNDPVVFHLARVNLSSLLLLIEDQPRRRVAEYGIDPGVHSMATIPHQSLQELLHHKSNEPNGAAKGSQLYE